MKSSMQVDLHALSAAHDVPLGVLRPRFGLQAARFADEERREAEAVRLAVQLADELRPLRGWFQPPADAALDLRQCEFGFADEAEARTVLTLCHYLRSFRRSSRHYVLRSPADDGGRVMALASVSPCDLTHITDALPFPATGATTRVLSRMFVFPWAPHNTISYLLSRVTREIERSEHEIRLLLTYVNPNLGFTGSSYRASNWVLLGEEEGTHYRYLDGRYVSDRELVHDFGTAEIDALRSELGSRIEESQGRLDPLWIYGYPFESSVREALSSSEPIRFLLAST